MKVNPAGLLSTSGIACVCLGTGSGRDPVTREARAAFVTQETVEASRAHDLASGSPGAPGWPDVKYGSVLVSRIDDDGRFVNRIYGPGKDAGVYLENVIPGRLLGFTGSLMADLRWSLKTSRVSPENTDYQRALDGVLFTQDLIISDQHVDRYPLQVVRDAFLCNLSSTDIRSGLAVSDAEFIRKSRSDMVRAMISRVSPEHPDGLMAHPAGFDTILSTFGVRDVAGRDPSIDTETLKSMVSGSEGLSRGVFSQLTRTPHSEMSYAMTDPSGFSRLRGALDTENALHSGDWVTKVRAHMDRILSKRIPGYSFNMILGSIRGQDILGIQDKMGSRKRNAYLYAWPTTDRIPVTRFGKDSLVSISPVDIPSREKLDHLESVHQSLNSESMSLKPDSGRPSEEVVSG